MTRAAGAQLELALGPYTNRKLFSDHFLRHVLPEWDEWRSLDVEVLLADLAALWDRERVGLETANEARTEERWIKPILERLGFAYTVQANVRTATGRRQPDYALLGSEPERLLADGRSPREPLGRLTARAPPRCRTRSGGSRPFRHRGPRPGAPRIAKHVDPTWRGIGRAPWVGENRIGGTAAHAVPGSR